MSVVSQANDSDLVSDFADYLRSIKGKYKIALITSAPKVCVDPLLEKIKCSDIFDFIYASPMDRQPKKEELFKEFIEECKKPDFYIGNGDKDISVCKKLGIKTISVSWVSKGKVKGDYDISSVSELEKIFA